MNAFDTLKGRVDKLEKIMELADSRLIHHGHLGERLIAVPLYGAQIKAIKEDEHRMDNWRDQLFDTGSRSDKDADGCYVVKGCIEDCTALPNVRYYFVSGEYDEECGTVISDFWALVPAGA